MKRNMLVKLKTYPAAAVRLMIRSPQLYLAFALLCKGSAVMTVRNTKANNGLEAWRGVSATYDSNNWRRQGIRVEHLLQAKRFDQITQTPEAVERLECDGREHYLRFGGFLDEDHGHETR